MAKTYKPVILNSNHWDAASERVEKSKIFKNSHRKKEANQVGYLGEVVFEAFLKYNQINFIDDRKKTTHDYTISDSLTLELKTKDRTVKPEKHFDNSVPLYNHGHQRPHYYYFISLLRDRADKSKHITRFTHAFILGAIDIVTLEKDGKHWKKGQIDASNNTQFWTDCINVSMEQLIDNNEMLKFFNEISQTNK